MANLRFTYSPPDQPPQPPPDDPDPGELTIEVSRPNALVAPALVWLKASGYDGFASAVHSGPVYDAALHEYHHEWTIDGEPLAPWGKVENLPSQFNNPNKAYGREVAFVLPAAGSYTISLTVTDRLGNTATTQTATLTVVSPESYYLDNERIYVDPEGVWAGVPAGAVKVQTIEEIENASPSASSGAKPPWVLFRGGVDHSFANTKSTRLGTWLISGANSVGYVSSYGGERARLVPADDPSRSRTKGMIELWKNCLPSGEHLTFTGFDLVGGFDVTTENGDVGNTYCINGPTFEASGCFVTLHDVDAYNITSLYQAGAGKTATRCWHAIANCDTPTGFRSFVVYTSLSADAGSTGKIAYLGNRFRQHPDALHGGGRYALSNRYGPTRIIDAEAVYIAQNDLFSRCGWSATGNSFADQPCIRLFTGRSNPGRTAIVERNALEGGYIVMYAMQSSTRTPTRPPENVLIENNFLVGSAKSGTLLKIGFGGVTTRNNLMIRPDTPRHSSWGGPAIDFSENKGQTADSAASPLVAYNNTELNLVSAANDGGNTPDFSRVDPVFTNVTLVNNIHHAPDASTPDTAQAPIDISTVLGGFTPRFKGVRYGYEMPRVTLPNDFGPGQSFEMPYSVFTKELRNGTPVDGGGPTDQAYWQAIEATDTRHAIQSISTSHRLFAEKGHFSVTFAATGVVFTNLTTNVTLPAGGDIRIHLDRASLIPPMDTSYQSSATIPLPVPQPGSPAYQGATSSDVAQDDLYRLARPASASMGAKEP